MELVEAGFPLRITIELDHTEVGAERENMCVCVLHLSQKYEGSLTLEIQRLKYHVFMTMRTKTLQIGFWEPELLPL